MFPAWTVVIGFWLGAVIGSFLNVVIYRLPRAIPLGKPAHSFCPTCKHRLGPEALIPLASWAFARGRCIYCKSKVPSRYFWVELLNASLWAWLWHLYFVVGPDAAWPLGAMYMFASAALVAIIFIDAELFIIPDEINAFLLFLGVGYGAFTGNVGWAIGGAFAGWAIIFGIAVLGRLMFRKDAMGHGDIKMMRGVGAVIGPALVGIDVFIGVIVGLVCTVLFMTIATIRESKADVATEAEEESEPMEPESVKDLFVLGVSYLLLFDIISFAFPKLYPKLGYEPEPENIEDDEWTPEPTALPFGPYLAIGALVCMLFRDQVMHGIDLYMNGMR